MTEHDGDSAEARANGTGPHGDDTNAVETLAALLRDLNELAAYLTQRGRHTYDLAQRFMEHARQAQDASSRAYDERQAVMLDYQHYLWMEIAGLVNKLLVTYGDGDGDGDSTQAGEPEADAAPENGDN